MAARSLNRVPHPVFPSFYHVYYKELQRFHAYNSFLSGKATLKCPATGLALSPTGLHTTILPSRPHRSSPRHRLPARRTPTSVSQRVGIRKVSNPCLARRLTRATPLPAPKNDVLRTLHKRHDEARGLDGTGGGEGGAGGGGWAGGGFDSISRALVVSQTPPKGGGPPSRVGRRG